MSLTEKEIHRIAELEKGLNDSREEAADIFKAIKVAHEIAINAVNELGDERDALVVVLTKIMNVVDRVNPAGRTCSIADIMNALLEIREAAFQAVAVPVEHESRRQPPKGWRLPEPPHFLCANCGKPGGNHCTIHVIPCCPEKCKGPQ